MADEKKQPSQQTQPSREAPRPTRSEPMKYKGSVPKMVNPPPPPPPLKKD